MRKMDKKRKINNIKNRKNEKMKNEGKMKQCVKSGKMGGNRPREIF